MKDTHWRGFYSSAEVQSVYSTAPADWAIHGINVKSVLFKIIQFSISKFYFEQFSLAQACSLNAKKPPVNSNHGLVLFNPYIGPFSGATTPGQSGLGSDGNKGELRIPQSSSITGTSPSDCLVSYQDTRWEVGSYPSAEKQSEYSTAPADRAKFILVKIMFELKTLIQCSLIFNLIRGKTLWKLYNVSLNFMIMIQLV